MSFILDALRKSEHERQRQTGPALVESAVAAPAARPNRWATAAIVLLVINLVAIGLVLLVKSRDEPASPPPSASTDATPSPAAAPSGPAPAPASTPSPGLPTGAPVEASVTRTLPATPPMMRPAPPPVSSGRNPLQEEVVVGTEPMADEIAEGAAAPPRGAPAVQTQAPVRPGTVVYQSLPEADPVAPQSAATADAGPGSNLPRADEMGARAGVPELRLELHVYSARPAERMVFINSRQYREGETTQEGATIEQITPEGVVMSMNGNRFLLARD